MSGSEQTTTVAVGVTDGYRYVGIQPPLTEDEAKTIGVEVNQYNQIRTIGHEATLLTVNGDNFRGGPTERDQHARGVAQDIAQSLRNLRDGPVKVWSKPVALRGYKSTPFNPCTD